MSRRDETGRVDPQWFEEQYARDRDPWGFEHEWYEHRKYSLTLAMLPRPRYRRALEPGCAMGVLSEGLAERCDALVALDPVPAVLERARQRLASFSHVDVRPGALPEAWPAGSFDLIVLSEVAYYLSPEHLDAVLADVEQSLERGGHLLAVHYRGDTDYPQTAEAVHGVIATRPWVQLGGRYCEAAFLIDWFERT